VARLIDSGDVAPIVNGSLNCGEFEFVPCVDPLEARLKICELVTHDLPAARIPSKNLQVLVPVHKGACGRKELNTSIRATFGRQEKVPAIGDRVIQTRNDPHWGVFNGQIGEIVRVDPGGFAVAFDDIPEPVAYGTAKSRQDGPSKSLDWANAVTVHKAQGSEFLAVVVAVFSSYSVMLLRNLYYTAVSRGRKKVIVIGDPDALRRAARNLRGKRRITKLAEFLNPDLDWPSRVPNMAAISYLELERKSEEEEAEEYLAALYAKQEKLIAKFEAGEATDEEIQWLINVGILVPVGTASETT
jgi:exodeoxyribonuclease V alpha subunit